MHRRKQTKYSASHLALLKQVKNLMAEIVPKLLAQWEVTLHGFLASRGQMLLSIAARLVRSLARATIAAFCCSWETSIFP